MRHITIYHHKSDCRLGDLKESVQIRPYYEGSEILVRVIYCPNCGAHNDKAEVGEEIKIQEENHWVASFDSDDDSDIHVQAEAETPMHAICLAALEATEKP